MRLLPALALIPIWALRLTSQILQGMYVYTCMNLNICVLFLYICPNIEFEYAMVYYMYAYAYDYAHDYVCVYVYE